MALADMLRSREETNVPALAEELGVSVRTLHRDIAFLRESGMSIDGEPGPGGGVRFDRPRGATSVTFTGDEIVALWLSARLSALSSALPLSRAAASATNKLLGGLSRERSRELQAMLARVVVSGPASVHVLSTLGVAPSDLLSRFEEAFRRRVGMRFRYRNQQGREGPRRIEPHGLLVTPPAWYILAFDVDKQAPRVFRMDRVAAPALWPEHSFRPDPRIVRALTEV